MLKKIIRLFSYFFSFVIPVNKRLLIFVSQPDYADNAYAVYLYMIKHSEFNNLKFCWLLEDLSKYKKIIMQEINFFSCVKRNVLCVKRKSILGIWISFRARYIINTCGLFCFIKYHQKDKRINLWHGMPIKSIWTSDGFPLGDYTIASSILFKNLMSKGLKVNLDHVLVIGQPRNDLMFHENLFFFPFLETKYKSVGIWMPTFRRTVSNEYTDGSYTTNNISFIKIPDLLKLNNYLNSINSFLIIKIHPLDILQNEKIPNYSNLIILNNKNFESRMLYPLLGKCDYLLTDFSSVAIDFEILNRPIGFIIDDYDEYKNTRGLFINDLPGKNIYNYNDLQEFIKEVTNKNYEIPKYENKFNLYKDSNSTKRLLNYFNNFC